MPTFSGVMRLICRGKACRRGALAQDFGSLLFCFVLANWGITCLRCSCGAQMVKLVVRDRETIQEAVRRFRKLVERSGIKKEMRRREYYEKPSETNRRARLRAERRSRRSRVSSR